MPGRSLVDYHHPGHWTAHEMKIAMSAKEYDSKFRFSIVRNPWDKMVSQHVGMCEKVLKSEFDPDEFNKYTIMALNDPADWDAALNARLRTDCPKGCAPGSHHRSYWPCSRWLSGDFHYVGRYEALRDSLREAFSLYERFSDKTFPVRKIQHLNNGSVYRGSNYQRYYSDETRKLVADRFAVDIDNFGYTFGG